jgi:hypothetical protein
MNIKGYSVSFLMLMLCGVMVAMEPEVGSSYSEIYRYKRVQPLPDLVAATLTSSIRTKEQFEKLIARPQMFVGQVCTIKSVEGLAELCARKAIGNGALSLADATLLAQAYCPSDRTLQAFLFARNAHQRYLDELQQHIATTSGYCDESYEDQLQKLKKAAASTLSIWKRPKPSSPDELLTNDVVSVMEDWIYGSCPSSLHVAVNCNNRGAVHFFLMMGQQATTNSLVASMLQGNVPLARDLMSAGAPIVLPKEPLWDQPIWYLLMKNYQTLSGKVNRALIRLLLRHGLDLNADYPMQYKGMPVRSPYHYVTLRSLLRFQEHSPEPDTREKATRALSLLEQVAPKKTFTKMDTNSSDKKRKWSDHDEK